MLSVLQEAAAPGGCRRLAWKHHDLQSDGFPMLSPTENLNVDWLPPSLNGGVIWVPMTPLVEDEALNEIYSILDTLQETNQN